MYVFNTAEAMIECCSCQVTANGLRRLDIAADLISNPLTGRVNVNGAIKIVSTLPDGRICDPTAISTLARALHSTATHAQGPADTGTPGGVTETPFLRAPLSAGELDSLRLTCAFVQFLGTGAGVCTCGPTPGSFSPEEVSPE